MAASNFRLRPSAAATWVLCGGHVVLSAGQDGMYDDDADNTVREEGTAAHWGAHQISQGIAVPAGTIAPNGVEVDDEALDAIDTYLVSVHEWGVPVFFEQELNCELIHPQCGGTADAIGFDHVAKIIYLGDFKYGYRFVDVHNNWQLICYFVGALRFYHQRIEDVDVQFMICQPRSPSQGGAVRQVRMRGVDLLPQIQQLQIAAVRALAADPLCVVNPGCGRCAGRHRCKTLQTAGLGRLDDSHTATPHDLPFSAAENELRLLQWAASVIDARITGLEQQVTHAMKRGAPSKHFGLSHSVGRLAWKEGAEPIVQNIALLMKENVNKTPQLITPTQAKKVLPPELVDMHSHRPNGTAKLVPADATLMRRIFGHK